MVGGSVVFFLVAGWRNIRGFWANLPRADYREPLYLGLVMVMGYELSRDVLRASQLVRELQASEADFAKARRG